ncbi:aldo/keto reductase [Falsihalocynthiibacter sp. BN13B15]|uniref:aldo/keto reductase n=1 Tax=Falsihalocynthiibacter sp. BN13B15 TaxID=3240871 RepID=UPI0035109D17
MKPLILTSANGTPASKYSFGTMQFGGKADKKESQKLFEASRNAGLNFFDTAYGYTGGLSETYLGEFTAKERDNLVVATKCAPVAGAASTYIRTQLDESRKRLKTDVIDVLYLHKWDDSTSLEETFSTLAELQEQGLFRYLGVSNFSAWQTMKAANIAEKHGLRIDILEPMYNLVKRQVEVEILPMASSEGFNVAPYSPLGGGLLTGKYSNGLGGRLAENKTYNARYNNDWMHETARKLSEIAGKIDISAATLAVAWVARNPAITHPIISARSVEQLAPSLDAITYELSDELYDEISAATRAPAPATDRSEDS